MTLQEMYLELATEVAAGRMTIQEAWAELLKFADEQKQSFQALLESIAQKHLRIPTLESRRSDRLDFHEVSVCGLKAALEAAFQAGKDAANAK